MTFPPSSHLIFGSILAAQKQIKDKQPSKLTAKLSKTETRPAQSKQKATKIKTDVPKRPKKSERTKRQSASSSPSTGLSRNSPKVRFNGSKSRNQSPKTSATPSGLSNSAPPSKPVRWPAALMKKCERLLSELMDHEDSWPFLTPVDELEV